VGAVVFSLVYLGLSLLEGMVSFADRDGSLAGDVAWLRRIYAPWRLVNTYHLFGTITRERIEPQLQTSVDGETWTEHDLRHKPGDPRRAPPIVAPHQPRVDFLLWFYGLDYRRSPPLYVRRLVRALCQDPEAVRPLFVGELPAAPRAVRIVFYDYRFSDGAERSKTGAWWTRRQRDVIGPVLCR
jgi:lipase maturation factor 1